MRVNAAWPNSEVVGRVESRTTDTIGVETYAGIRFVPLAAVKRIDVSIGRSHSDGTVRGMKMGAIGVGGTVALFLVAVHFVSDGDSCGGDECIDALALAPVLVPTGVVVGGVVGGVIGLLAGSEQWDGLYFAPPRVSILPQRGGATRIGLSLHF